MSDRTCNQCGWVHFGVTRKFAEAEVARFNAFYEASTPSVQKQYGGPSHIRQYLWCNACGNSHVNFRDSKPGDCPDGCTISPIVVPA